MASMTNILRALEGHVLSHRCTGDSLSPHLLLLEKNMVLSPLYTYLGTAEALRTAKVSGPVTVLLTEGSGTDLPNCQAR